MISQEKSQKVDLVWCEYKQAPIRIKHRSTVEWTTKKTDVVMSFFHYIELKTEQYWGRLRNELALFEPATIRYVCQMWSAPAVNRTHLIGSVTCSGTAGPSRWQTQFMLCCPAFGLLHLGLVIHSTTYLNTLLLSSRARWRCELPVLVCVNSTAVIANVGISTTWNNKKCKYTFRKNSTINPHQQWKHITVTSWSKYWETKRSNNLKNAATDMD